MPVIRKENRLLQHIFNAFKLGNLAPLSMNCWAAAATLRAVRGARLAAAALPLARCDHVMRDGARVALLIFKFIRRQLLYRALSLTY